MFDILYTEFSRYVYKKKTYNIKEMDIFSSEELLMIVEILNEE